ncbi:hypothetical protein GLOIN_2v1772421 [Rhizophagus clarus]|uniref:Uncharacterized protein n=1 Tax=Rhizophagus clarus TaxID=94130 RepID=A0A8H3LUS8_9GLOM|nr:hypothetical protein GLOIN_2v1772421 [Rhizophagus clarus]
MLDDCIMNTLSHRTVSIYLASLFVSLCKSIIEDCTMSILSDELLFFSEHCSLLDIQLDTSSYQENILTDKLDQQHNKPLEIQFLLNFTTRKMRINTFIRIPEHCSLLDIQLDTPSYQENILTDN